MTKTLHEEWRPVVDYEGRYAVSNQGRVKSLARKDRWGRPVRERILRPGRDTDGYLRVVLCRDGRPATAGVHRLVCAAFHGPAPAGKPHALHGNHDPSDNRPENLRWGNNVDNMQDKVDADRQAKGETSNKSKLTEADVRAIQDELLAGATQRAVAARYGLTRVSVSCIARGETWAHIANPELQARFFRKKRRKTLSDEEILRVYDLAAQGLLQCKIGARLGVTPTTIGNILRTTTPRYAALRSQWLASRPAQ